jgi:hypothetical protein
MAPTDPSAEHNSRRPRTWSSTQTRAFAKGTRGAQLASPKPATRKEARVALRVLGRSAVNASIQTPCLNSRSAHRGGRPGILSIKLDAAFQIIRPERDTLDVHA